MRARVTDSGVKAAWLELILSQVPADSGNESGCYGLEIIRALLFVSLKAPGDHHDASCFG
jgi:hypothetical protein